MKFKEGDKVKVRSLEAMKREFGLGEYDEPNTSIEFTLQMERFCGQEVTIAEVHSRFYKIEEDYMSNKWTDEMFEGYDLEYVNWKDNFPKENRYFETENGILYNADCLDILNQMPDNSVDLVLTDPPYGIKYKSNWRTKSPKFEMLANDNNSTRFLVYPEMYRTLKDNSVSIVFASWKNYAEDYIELSKHFDIKNAIVWWKHGGGIGDLKHTLLTDYEIAIICHKGKCKIRGKRCGSVWECSKVSTNKMLHPTQKPEKLFEGLIEKYSDSGATVLDCFIGSGTTAVACEKINRRWLGIELHPEYCEITKQRLLKTKQS